MRTYVSASIFGLLPAPPIAETTVSTNDTDDWSTATAEDIATSASERLASYEKLATKAELACIYRQMRAQGRHAAAPGLGRPARRLDAISAILALAARYYRRRPEAPPPRPPGPSAV